jgi:hypothetical protein
MVPRKGSNAISATDLKSPRKGSIAISMTAFKPPPKHFHLGDDGGPKYFHLGDSLEVMKPRLNGKTWGDWAYSHDKTVEWFYSRWAGTRR